MMLTVSVLIDRAHYRTRVSAGNHVIIADESEALGGGDEGMDPFELLFTILIVILILLHLFRGLPLF